MTDGINCFWSCKLKRPDTLKRHKTFDTAAKRAGDHGFVYSEADKTVKQIFQMSNNTLQGVDVDKLASRCNTGGFDMRETLRSFNIIE
jgi:hypothetical protein